MTTLLPLNSCAYTIPLTGAPSILVHICRQPIRRGRDRRATWGREGRFCGIRSRAITEESMFIWICTNPELLLKKCMYVCAAKELTDYIHENILHYNTPFKPQASIYSSYQKGHEKQLKWCVCLHEKCSKNSSLVHTSASISPAVIWSVYMTNTKARV